MSALAAPLQQHAYDGLVATPTTRIAGIPVEFPMSGILGVALLAYLWIPAFTIDSAWSPWVLALVFAVLLSLATLVHEFAHALVARAFGFPVHRVVLQLLGGVTHFERNRQAPMAEATVAAAGPIATFALAGVTYAATRVLDPASAAGVLARALTWANVIIGIYNSLPGIPLDGGNVLRCLIWAASGSERRGTVVAAWVGRGLALLTLLSPLALSLMTGVQPDLLVYVIAGLVAAMLYAGATAQLRAVDLRTRAGSLTAGGWPGGPSRSIGTSHSPRRSAVRPPPVPGRWSWSMPAGSRPASGSTTRSPRCPSSAGPGCRWRRWPDRSTPMRPSAGTWPAPS